MANVVQWQAGWTSRGTVLTTELNSLAAGSYSAAGPEVDLSTVLDQYAKLVLYLDTLSPTSASPYVQVHMITAPDGTNYAQAPAADNPANNTIVARIPIATSASATKRAMSTVFMIEPAKTKFVIYDGAGVALASANNTLTLYTTNDELQ